MPAPNSPTSDLPYARQSIDDDDVAAVVHALRSPLLTTGPQVAAFEADFAALVHAAHAVAVSSGTAALHAAMFAIDAGPGDEVIVPPLTFVATANAVVYQGATPVFADVDPATLLIDPACVEATITPRTKAVVAVDYAGQPCDYARLRDVCRRRGLKLVADACHALGGADGDRPAGSLADLSAFSFHPVKHVTTGEGGMVTTDDGRLAQRLRAFRNHGITSDHHQRRREGSCRYEMLELGWNYRLSDVQCALGRSQLRKLAARVARRREIAATYDELLRGVEGVEPLAVRERVGHAYHLYVVRIGPGGGGHAAGTAARLEAAQEAGATRDLVFSRLRAAGIGAAVHYPPVHLHPYYRRRFGLAAGLCPVAEAAAERLLSLPMFPEMTKDDVGRVVAALQEALHGAVADGARFAGMRHA